MPDAAAAATFTVPSHLVFRAIRQGDTAALESYLKQGTDLSARNEAHNTPLHFAIVQGKTRHALMLIAAGAPLDAQGEARRTPLMLALALGSNAVAAALLEKGADIALADKFNKTAIDIVRASGNPKGAQLLFARMGGKGLHENVMWAIREEDLDSLKFLVEKMGAKLSAPGPAGEVPASDMTLWGGGPVADYVAQVTARETAQEAARGLSRSVTAPRAARFRA